MNRQRLTKLTFTAMVAAICAVGAVIKIPAIISTAALDSAPAFLSVVFLSPVLAGVAGGIGHFITALTTGFPFGPLHIIIAVEMFIVVWIFGIMHKKRHAFLEMACSTFFKWCGSTITILFYHKSSILLGIAD